MESVKAQALPQNPRERTNPLSYLFFCWTLPLFFKGRKKELEVTDLYAALDDHRSKILGDRMRKAWDKELLKLEKKKNPSLLKATLHVFGWRLALQGLILLILEISLRVSQPVFLGLLVSYYSKPEEKSEYEAYIYAAGIILCSAFSVLFMHPYMLSQMHLGMKLRLSVCSMIYRKTLRLSKTALGETTAGQVVNLLSNDVGRLDLSVLFIHYLWIGPLETLIVTYLMYREIGISAVAGVAFMLSFIPLQGYLGKKTSVLRLKTALRTDERVRLMNEIIQGIQVIKMYAWEKPFATIVSRARKREIDVIRHVSYIRGVLLSFIMFLTRVSIFMSLLTYALLGQMVTADRAFVITAYYNILRQAMTVFLPNGISQVAETLVSFGRIQKFLLYGETDLKNRAANTGEMEGNNHSISPSAEDEKQEESVRSNQNAVLSEASIIISQLKAKWNLDSTDYTLDDINLRAQPGSLVAVIGPVGAGKSSLIQTILGELPKESGSIIVNGKISYASQEPWLFTGTVRQNILFGEPMNRKRYKEVIKQCALQRDFELLPYGDKTIVGERGASLSGGQKARISLARAVYRDCSVYLLDDPLSAVDTHVGRHLFDQCMKDFLREKTVILITHQLQFLQQADQIVIIENGKVSAVGTYDNLRESGLDFAKMLAESHEGENDESSEIRRSGSLSLTKQRRSSETSVESVENPDQNSMQAAEKGKEGAIGFKLYADYFKAGGGYCGVIVMFLICIIAQTLGSGGDYFVNYWVNKNQEVIESGEQFSTENGSTVIDLDALSIESGNQTDVNQMDYLDLYIFSAIIVGTILVTLSRSFVFFTLAMRSSRILHNAMFDGITRASMFFFNTNPSGRILNRFSKDMGQIDEILPSTMIDVIQIFLSLFGIVIVVALVNYWLMVPTLAIGIIFYFLRDFYLKTSRNVKRLEAITRSPIYSHLSASLNGLSTIRVFKAEEILMEEFDNHQDLHSSAFYAFMSTGRAFGFWLDSFCVLYIAIVTVSFFITGTSYGGNVGLAISQAIGLTGMVQWGMRQSAELENNMTSVERVVEYEKIEQEGQLDSPPEKKPPSDWPDKGHIKFDKLSLSYFPDPNSERVLKSLTFDILPKEKIGIVGRTGAGKSSMINALFRLSYNQGVILIDGRNIQEIGLHDLRSKISIIPQEPVLFSGTMRYNLDPFDEYVDAKLWQALEEVKLKEVVSELPYGLQSKISEGGSNFSVGQRQLVCLARAILRENRILLMDEATANVDPQTDGLIQATIREKFRDCTVLTIAHRLHTVMDSDKVIVMDAGKVIEMGAPYELLTESSTKIFEGMVRKLGKSTYESLQKIAQRAYEENKNK